MRNSILVAILAISVTGCGDEKIDASTDEKFKSSMEAVKNSLTEAQKPVYENAVKVLAFSEVGNPFAAIANPEAVQTKIKDK